MLSQNIITFSLKRKTFSSKLPSNYYVKLLHIYLPIKKVENITYQQHDHNWHLEYKNYHHKEGNDGKMIIIVSLMTARS